MLFTRRLARRRVLLAATALAGIVAGGLTALHVEPRDHRSVLARRAAPAGVSSDVPSVTRVAYAATAQAGLDVRVSATFPDAADRAQRWAAFFDGLPHGAELGTLRVNVVSEAELMDACGPQAYGCYREGVLTFADATLGGVSPEGVARHEYGHHVAASRSNAPWPSVDWGPKRWASVAGVCADVQRGTAFPGNEGDHYTENPGEAWAEVYRILAERAAGVQTGIWSVVVTRYYPTEVALAAAAEDVARPWKAPTFSRLDGAFVRGGPRVWQRRLATPLDGTLTVTLKMPVGPRHDVAVLDLDGRTVLGRWTTWTSRSRTVTTTICGRRAVLLRVAEGNVPSAFSLVVSGP